AVDSRLQMLGRGLKDDDLEYTTRQAYEFGKKISAQEYAAAVACFHAIGRRISASMEDIDIVLTPALTRPPISLGELCMDMDYWAFREKLSRYVPFYSVFNATGQPAAVIPTEVHADGMPMSAQMVGR